MSAPGKFLKTAWRLVCCLVLLLWVFHSIFLKEGKNTADALGLNWDGLSRWEQCKFGWHYGPIELWRTLCLIHPGLFTLALLAILAVILLGVVRWRIILRVHGLELSLWRATEISFVAQFFNSFLLGTSGGDLMKAYYVARETHHRKAETVAAVFVDRLIGLWSILLFGGIMMLPNTRLLFQTPQLQALSSLYLAMLGGCTALLIVAFWGGVSQAWGGARRTLRRLPKGETLERLLDSCRFIGREPAVLLETLAVSFVANGFCVLQVWIISYGLNLSIDTLALMVIVPVIYCISALPITPNGLGVREKLFVVILAAPTLQIPATLALSLSLLVYGTSLLWSVLGGVVYLLFKERHHLSEAALGMNAGNEPATPPAKDEIGRPG